MEVLTLVRLSMHLPGRSSTSMIVAKKVVGMVLEGGGTSARILILIGPNHQQKSKGLDGGIDHQSVVL